MEINPDNIPEYLRDSDFFRGLNPDQEDLISIPILKLDGNISDLDDFLEFFKTINFFGLRKYPKNFIKFYQKNPIDVFKILDNGTEEEDFLLRDLVKLKIKNPYQFFVTYKIINKFSLNPENYSNYLDYAINNCKEIVGNGEYYIINDEDFENLVDKVSGTIFIEFISLFQKGREFIIDLKIKKCQGPEEDYLFSQTMKVSIFSFNKDEFIENVINLILSIKNDKYFLNKHTRNTILDIMTYPYEYPRYYDKKLTLLKEGTYENVSFKINEFNKNNTIEELEKILSSNRI